MTDVDVIVAGGGPVGLATAIEARLAGLSVAVIEPREGAVDKACGEGLMPGALPLLNRLGVDPVGMPLRGVSYRDETRHADHRFQTGEGRGVRRTTLHASLSERAAALGIELVTGRVDAVSQDSTGVAAAGLRGDWLFACDGLNSSVRREIGLERTLPASARSARGRRFGLRQHYEIEPWTDLIEVYWADHAEVYVTPVSPTLIGLATLGVQHTDFDATIAGIPRLAKHLADARPVGSRRGAGPFRQRAARASSGRVLLIGDASGYVDAITGEGLRLGFDQARVAVECIVAGAPQRYDREWARVTRQFRVLTSTLVRAASSPLRGAIVPLAVAAPRIYGSIVERLAR